MSRKVKPRSYLNAKGTKVGKRKGCENIKRYINVISEWSLEIEKIKEKQGN